MNMIVLMFAFSQSKLSVSRSLLWKWNNQYSPESINHTFEKVMLQIITYLPHVLSIIFYLDFPFHH